MLVQLRLPSFTAFHVCCDTRAHKSPFWGKGTVCPKKPNWSTQGTENNYSGYETNTNTKLHFRMQLHEPKEIQTASLREEQRAASISVDLCLVWLSKSPGPCGWGSAIHHVSCFPPRLGSVTHLLKLYPASLSRSLEMFHDMSSWDTSGVPVAASVNT